MLTREQIVEARERLDRALAAQAVRAELYLVGGAVMCVALEARPSTKDVDGWFTEPQAVRRAAAEVARDMDLPDDWLNDAAKAYIPQGAVFERWRAFESLDVSVADERTLLAMKCAAARTQEDSRDIRTLAGRLGLTRASEVLATVTQVLSCRSAACPHSTAHRGALSMTAAECLHEARIAGDAFQRIINQFVDEFRRAAPEIRREMVRAPILSSGPLEGLVAGVVSALCRETGLDTPAWAGDMGSPEPFFPFPAESFAMRLRLMIESPPPFRIRRVFVPENYLSRA